MVKVVDNSGGALDQHYLNMKIQPMDFALSNQLDPAQQTIIKYVTRWDLEGGKGLRDLKAAHLFLGKYIVWVETGEWPT